MGRGGRQCIGVERYIRGFTWRMTSKKAWQVCACLIHLWWCLDANRAVTNGSNQEHTLKTHLYSTCLIRQAWQCIAIVLPLWLQLCWLFDLWSKLNHHHRDPLRKSIRFTWNPKAWLANEPANEWIPIFGLFLFVSLSLQHDSAWCLSIPCWLANPSFLQYLDGSFQSSQTSPETGIWKTPPQPNSNDLIVFRISSWNLFEYLCQSTQRRLSCNTSFLRSTSLELPFGAWKRSQARPKSAENRSPLLCHFEYLQRNNVGQMLWKCAPCSVHCKPDYEMCSVKLCTRQMAMSSQWDKCHKMDVNSRKSNSYFWSLVGPTTEGTRSMHRSWW